MKSDMTYYSLVEAMRCDAALHHRLLMMCQRVTSAPGMPQR